MAGAADGETAPKGTASVEDAPDGTSLQRGDSTTFRYQRVVGEGYAVKCTQEIVQRH